MEGIGKPCYILASQNEELIEAITSAVESSVEIESVTDFNQAEKLLLAMDYIVGIIVDVELSVKDSEDFIGRISKIQVLGDKPIIVIVGNENAEEINKLFSEGAYDVIIKPIIGAVFCRRLRNAAEYYYLKSGKDQNNNLSKKTVLVVDDNKLDQTLVCRLLEKYGYDAECAVNGLDAVQLITGKPKGHYSAIIMDIRMTVMDGITATKEIRKIADDYTKNIPIISMTSNAYDDNVIECLSSGMNAFLAKPVNPEKLKKTLATFIV